MRLGYARVSTADQSDSLPAQVQRLQEAGCDLICRDVESGRENDREGLLEAMALIKAGKVQELIVTRLDRLGRDAAYADHLLFTCAKAGVTVRALDGGQIDSESPQGFLMSRLLTTMAEVESKMLSLRIRRQFEAYRRQGRHLRRRVAFGYRAGPDHRLEPHPEHWPLALRVLEELRTQGTFTRVAQRLPDWCPWTPAAINLQRWFVNPVIRGHLGHLRQGDGWRTTWGELYRDQHPPLISEADWQELAAVLQQTRNRFGGGGGAPAQHGLTGLLVCRACNHRLRRSSSAGAHWWSCRHRLCQERGRIREDRALAVVIQACIAAAEDLAAAAAQPVDEDPRIVMRENQLQELRRLSETVPGLEGSIAALRAEIDAMRGRPLLTPDLADYVEILRDPVFFSGATAEEQRALFAQALLAVRIGRGDQPPQPVPRGTA